MAYVWNKIFGEEASSRRPFSGAMVFEEVPFVPLCVAGSAPSKNINDQSLTTIHIEPAISNRPYRTGRADAGLLGGTEQSRLSPCKSNELATNG